MIYCAGSGSAGLWPGTSKVHAWFKGVYVSTTMDLRPVLDFLSQLKENNNKPWFDRHRAEYESARDQFESLVGKLIEGFSSFMALGGILPKDCVMRIYRDIRFSKDKSPYRTNMGASIGPGGGASHRVSRITFN